MERVVTNLIASVRRETLNSREYLVGPLTLIVPGVLNGSQGPLYYPPEEITRSTTAWNGTPIVVYHPTIDGGGVSARNPEVLNGSGIGYIYHTKAEGKLTAEGWFDVDAIKRVDNRILMALEAGKPMELSTGLFTDNEPAPEGSNDNGKAYTYIARNYRPDHVAILPDGVGACSIQDGCGVLVNGDKDKLGELLGVVPECNSNKGETNMANPIVDKLLANSECWDEKDREALETLSDDKLEQLVANMEKPTPDPVSSEFEDEQGNKHVFNRETEKWETTLKEKEEEPPVENKEEEVKEQKPQTTEEWMGTAPTEIQSAVRNAMAIEAREKTELIEQMVSNLNDEEGTSVRKQLEDLDLEKLRGLAVLVPKSVTVQPNYMGAAGSVQNTKSAEEGFAPFGLPHEYVETGASE